MIDARPAQTALVKLGYQLTVDGNLGPKTMGALLQTTSKRGALPLGPALAANLVARMGEADISTALRLRHFLAQTACETAGFTRLKESDGGDPSYFNLYEMRRDLGNTRPGDGARYCGRGLLDTTGKANYARLAALSGLDCVAHPELLEDPANAVASALAYWKDRNCNAPADANDIRQVTLRINGGYNGLSDRLTYFNRLGVLQ